MSQKNVPLGEVCPSPKGTFFWDTLYITILLSSYLSNLLTFPLCSSTSQTQATCSWVNPNELMEELEETGVGGAKEGSALTPVVPGGAPKLGKFEKLERH